MNYLAIVIAAVVILILAGVWYGGIFAKQWMALQGMSEEDGKNMSKMTYVYELINSMVMYAVLFMLIDALGGGTLQGALEVGITVWLGFMLTGMFSDLLRSKDRKWGLLWINAGFSLLAVIVGAVVYTFV